MAGTTISWSAFDQKLVIDGHRYWKICLNNASDEALSTRSSVTSRCAVECGAGGPQAGQISYRGLQASSHSAADRAGTVLDGQFKQIVTKQARRDHRGWSTHLASRRCHLAQPNQPHNRSFVTPGGIGTHAMHLPSERAIRKYRVRLHHKIKPLRFPVRAYTAVRPYAEDLSPAARTGCS